uniref:RUN and SH3 domain-containing protein 1 isoform X1 n=1 Tax=Geotrypetes seraphini TaxID=260995 RepID=A0A6P8PXW6_GEOSA|nr:RUN and SH3 domain-containing protein 1 isoform X1 [Geotrypetes seraphini]
MLSPKKGILCNLNNIHLQHVSLGIHLALRPEVQEGPVTRAPRDVDDQPMGCRTCHEMGSVTLEVDANSNSSSLQCKCCDSHPQIKLGPVNSLPNLQEMPYVDAKDAASPSDPVLSPISVSSSSSSSSISSCSDLTLDDTPVSTYSKKFPLNSCQTSQGQPEIVPMEDNSGDASLLPTQPFNHSSDGGYSSQLHQVQNTQENLYNSSPKLDPNTSPMQEDAEETSEDPVTLSNWKQLDSNCNALPNQGVQCMTPLVPTVPEHLGLNQNTIIQPFKVLPGDGGAPDLPSSKDGVGRVPKPEVLNIGAGVPGTKAQKPLFGHINKEPRTNDANQKIITSFHELAQKRKRSAVGSMPQQAKKDRSDWLIVFSPDTELPPANEFTISSWCQQSQELQSQQAEQVLSQREVTTFKELKYRHSMNKHASLQSKFKPEDDHWQSQMQQHKQAGVADGQADYKLRDHLNAEGLQDAKEAPKLSTNLEDAPRRKMSRPGLQPIAEGLWREADELVPSGGTLWMKQKAESVPGWRSVVPSASPWLRGKADGRDRHSMEALSAFPSATNASLSSQHIKPQRLSFTPLLLHLSADGKPAISHGPAVAFRGASPHEKAQSPRRAPDWPCTPEELLPARLSPVGAYSPPHRGFLPLLRSPDLSMLLSPLFPRYRLPTATSLPASPPWLLPALSPTPQVSRAQLGPASELPRRELSSGVPQERASPAAPPRRSISLPGALGTHLRWMADRDGGTTQVLDHKRGLLIAVSFSVDRIISHFSTTRNIVQKAQLGDSRLTPEVGHLLLNTLFPALYALVADGLKPFQSDVIVGRRRSSPWSVVEASVKPGLSTRCLHYLYSRICNLPQLSSTKKKFNAFLFGLLNIKQLEFWISHLQKQSGLFSVLYTPDAFLALREAPFQHLFEELLLLLQPLSVLSFHLDLLFEHHHLHVDVEHLSCTLPCQLPLSLHTDGFSRDRNQGQQAEKVFQAATKDQSSETGSGQELSTVSNEETRGAVHEVSDNLGLVCEPKPSEPPLVTQLLPEHQNSVSLQQPSREVLQWSDKFPDTVAGNEEYPEAPSTRLKCSMTQPNKGLSHAIGPMSWWGQLSQASRIYTSSNKENFPLSRWTKLPRAIMIPMKYCKLQSEEKGAGKAGECIPERWVEIAPLLPEDQREEKDSQQAPCIHQETSDSAASGRVDPSFTNGIQKLLNEGNRETDAKKLLNEGSRETDVQKLHEEGSHATDVQKSDSEGTDRETYRRECSPGEADSCSGGKELWLGRLFGAYLSPTKESSTDSEMNAMKSRRPSRWLAPNLRVYDLVRKSPPPKKTPQNPPQEDGLKPQRAVRALCDHAGSEQSHLSFRKGDILQVVSTVDEDWICCENESSRGLVPVGYTSLIL